MTERSERLSAIMRAKEAVDAALNEVEQKRLTAEAEREEKLAAGSRGWEKSRSALFASVEAANRDLEASGIHIKIAEIDVAPPALAHIGLALSYDSKEKGESLNLRVSALGMVQVIAPLSLKWKTDHFSGPEVQREQFDSLILTFVEKDLERRQSNRGR